MVYQPRKTKCKNGHTLTEENTRLGANGKQHCRTCQREATERWRERKGELKPGRGANNAAKTHCPEGHPYDEENTGWTIKKATGNPSRYCRTCARANSVVQRFKKYGLTEAAFDELLASQGNACAICRKQFKNGKDTHIDHHHDGGFDVVRGVLCGSCNKAIGGLRDSPSILIAAAEYLLRSNKWTPGGSD